MGVTYKQLVEIIQTGFVNPKLDQLVVLSKLGVSISSVRFCRDPQNKAFYDQNKDLIDKERAALAAADQARFDALSPEDWEKLKELQAFDVRLEKFCTNVGLTLADTEAELQGIPFDNILVLADPDAGCTSTPRPCATPAVRQRMTWRS